MPPIRVLDYTDAIADEICERLADGESLRNICLDKKMPARSTVFRWLSLHPTFSDQYAKAKEAQAELLADEIVGISDGADSQENDVQRDRLRVDARKWVASKLLAKKYGDKVQTEHSGPDGGPIVVGYKSRLADFLNVKKSG